MIGNICTIVGFLSLVVLSFIDFVSLSDFVRLFEVNLI